MKAFLESLSFSSGAVLIAVLSAGVVWLLCFTCASSLRKFWVVVVPLALTNCLYWSVAWLEAEGDEYHRELVMSDYHNWALLIHWCVVSSRGYSVSRSRAHIFFPKGWERSRLKEQRRDNG